MKVSLSSLLPSPSKKSHKKKSNHLVSPSESEISSSGVSFSSEMSSPPPPSTIRVSREELESVLRRLGPDPPTEDEIRDMLAEAGTAAAGDGCVSIDDIAALAVSAAEKPELEEVFAVIDRDQDGVISAEELRALFVMLGDDKCSIEDCRRMIGVVDSNGDGFVCFNDFARMMGSESIPVS